MSVSWEESPTINWSTYLPISYAKNQLIEANTMKTMAVQLVLPAAFAYRKDLADVLNGVKSLGFDVSKQPELKTLNELTDLAVKLQAAVANLDVGIHKVESAGDPDLEAEVASKEIVTLMADLRTISDAIEDIVADKHWPFPKYLELLF